MSNRLKKILTATSAVLLLAGVGASANGINVSARRRMTHRVVRHHVRRHARRTRRNHRRARRHTVRRGHKHNRRTRRVRHVRAIWHRGMPSVFHNYRFWISGYTPIRSSWGRYMRISSPMSYKYGFNGTPAYYNKRHHQVTTGADMGAAASINPHYLNLGHGWYKITSGGSGNNAKSLRNELRHTMSDDGSTELVHVHNQHAVSIWVYENGNSGKTDYQGYFKPYHKDFLF